MEEQKIKIKVKTEQGFIEKTGIRQEVIETNETWSTYKLADGTTIKIKNILIDLVKLEDVQEDGISKYSAKLQPIIAVEI